MNNLYVPVNIHFKSISGPEKYLCTYYIEYLLGMYLGTVIAMPLAGILAEHINWESIFYVFGASIFSENFSHCRFQGFTKTSAQILIKSFFGSMVIMVMIMIRISGSALVRALVVDCGGLARPGPEHH